MKIKILCMLMCFVMIFSVVLTSCSSNTNTEEGEDEADTEESTRLPITLSLWLPTDSSTTDEAISQVEDAINRLTEAKFDTHIEFHAIPSDQYESTIEGKINDINDVELAKQAAAESQKQQAIDDAIAGILPGERGEEIQTTVEEETGEPVETVETAVDENGLTVTVYPEVAEDQFDIFLLKGYDKYMEYISEGLIQSIDTELADVGKKLYSYIYPAFMNLAKIEGSTYGVPNNHQLGEYQFLLVNKELVEQYDYSPEELSKFVDCEGFITDIGNQKIDGVTPLLGPVEPANVVYFGLNGSDEFSVIGSQITPDVRYNTKLEPQRTLEIADYTATLGVMKRLESLGYVGNGDPASTGKFAVGVVSGDAELAEQYKDDYYVYTHACPVADADDVFESVLAVSTYSADVSRAVEIITYINTDQTLRTILQYGVEGVNWELDSTGEEEVIRILNDDYKMDIINTGNVYMTYPGEGIPMSYWDYAKQQNLDSATNPYVGFEYVNEINTAELTKLAALSADVWEQLETFDVSDYDRSAARLTASLITNTLVDGELQEAGNDEVMDSILSEYGMYYSMK